MFDLMARAAEALREAVAEMRTGSMGGDQAAEFVRLLTEIERVAAAGRAIALRRVEETKAWQGAGHRTAAQWVAATTGTTLGHAIGVLETARRLDELPATREEFCAGRLSEVQARAISESGTTDPSQERALLDVAREETVSTLREESRRVRAAAVPDEIEAYDAIRRSRYLRHWTDVDGSVRLDARLTPDAGATVIAAIDDRRDRLVADARGAGNRESLEAHAADALVELARGGDERRPRAMVHGLVDHRALAAARASSQHRCEIPGVGRIPAATARALAEDAILKTVVTRGSDVTAVAHWGRTIPARVRTALEVRDRVCVVPGCDVRRGLEIDHYRIPFAAGGPTRLDNLARLCAWHHYQKTHLGYRLGGGPGAWLWETPSDQEALGPGPRPPPHA